MSSPGGPPAGGVGDDLLLLSLSSSFVVDAPSTKAPVDNIPIEVKICIIHCTCKIIHKMDRTFHVSLCDFRSG
jgi:hypothetical protein